MILSYLGSKASMLHHIDSVVKPLLKPDNSSTFCDLFLGTGCVANHYKKYVKSISGCDTEVYSYVLSYALCKSSFSFKLAKCIDTLNDMSLNDNTKRVGLVTKHFSNERLFFLQENALKIDFWRISIDTLYKQGIIDYSEFIFLLASLLKSTSKVANTTGTFRTYLKSLSKKATKPIFLEPIHKDKNKIHVEIKNTDVLSFVKKMDNVDITYIDPPYNSVHYSAYYSFLNYLCLYNKTIALTSPGVIQDYYKSKFGLVKNARNELKRLLDLIQGKTKYIILSYSSCGVLSISVLTQLLKIYGKVKVYRFAHKKYQSNKKSAIKRLAHSEYIFVLTLAK